MNDCTPAPEPMDITLETEKHDQLTPTVQAVKILATIPKKVARMISPQEAFSKSLAEQCLSIVIFQPKKALTASTVARITNPESEHTENTKNKIIRALQKSGRLSDEFLPHNFFHSSLKRVDILNGKVSDSFLVRLSASCVNLKGINVSGCFKLGDAAILTLLRNCKGLKELNIENCRKLTDTALTYMITDGGKLKSINIGGDFNMTIGGIRELITSHPEHKNFKELHLSGHVKLYDDLVNEITEKCKKLQALSIGYTEVTAAMLMKLLRRRTAISKLRVHWCRHMTDDFIKFLPECASLTELDITGNKGINKDVIKAMLAQKMNPVQLPEGEKGPQPVPLKVLRVRYCGWTKDTIAAITEAYPNLYLGGSYQQKGGSWVWDADANSSIA